MNDSEMDYRIEQIMAEIKMVMDLYDEKLNSLKELDLISNSDYNDKDSYCKNVTKVYRNTFKANKKRVMKTTIDYCIETILEEKGRFHL